MRAQEYLRDVHERYNKWEREAQTNGQRSMLRNLLERTFGEMPSEIHAKLDQATVEQLEVWGLRFRAAETVTNVFAN